MGWLFGASKEDLEKAKEKLRTIFSENDYLYNLIQDILDRANKDEKWVTNCQGYYDSRKRTVVFGEDLVGIVWYTEKTIKDNAGNLHKEKEIHRELMYAHTASGYRPLYSYTDKSTMTTLSVDETVEVFASIFKNKMEQYMPECKFGVVHKDNGEIMFKYDVPALEWQDWF